MAMSGETEAAAPQTALQRRLMHDIAAHLRAEGLGPGAPVNLLALARRFGVSRSPVRAALGRLSLLGVVEMHDGAVRVADPAALDPDAPPEPDPVETLMAAIARERFEGQLPAEVSEADLMRRTGSPRRPLVEALRRMAGLGLVQRKPGHGWRFAEEADARATEESYRFRLLVEPGAMREPGYAPDLGWVAEAQAGHRRYLHRRWQPEHAIGFFEMNAAFHRQLVAFSGNRWMVQAIEQQNSLRRLRNWSWRLDDDRVRESCVEHLAVLDALAAGDTRAAAEALHRHIAATMESVG